MNFALEDIQSEVLCPFNIYWIKKDGSKVLINREGEFVNIDLISRLSFAEATLEAEMGESEDEINTLLDYFDQYESEKFLKDKMKFRALILQSFKKMFIDMNCSQVKVNYLVHRIFSSDECHSYFKKDCDQEILSRNLSIASVYVLMAFYLGHYDMTFLRRNYSSTFIHLMELGKNSSQMAIKEKINYLRMQERLSEEDKQSAKDLVGDLDTVLFEKFSGEGLNQINIKEMSDLESVLVSLFEKINFDDSMSENIFKKVVEGKVEFKERVQRFIKKELGESIA